MRNNDDKFHIIGFQYLVQSPAWLVRPWPGCGDMQELSLKGELSLEFVGPRRCVGYRIPGEMVRQPCPNSAVVDQEKSQCAVCVRKDGFRDSFFVRRDVSRSEAWHQYAENKVFAVYLAAYDVDTIKVGMAVRWRLEERLREQGAWMACLLLESDGYTARKIERAVSSIGYPERLSVNKRLESIYPLPDQKRLKDSLLKARMEIARYLADTYNLLDPPVLLSLFDDYYHDGAEIKKTPVYVKVPETAYISGKVRFVKGSLVILEWKENLFVIDAWRTAGWTMSECPPRANAFSNSGQLTLL